MESKNIAIVGSGISGLSAAYLLSRRHTVTLFESSDRLGGHANTVSTPCGQHIDTGFVVFNKKNYPYFCKLLNELNVPIVESDMSFAYVDPIQNHYYSSDIPWGIFSKKSTLFSPSFYKFIFSIASFNKESLRDLPKLSDKESLNDYLQRKAYSPRLIREYVLPMGAAIWSTSEKNIGQFPAKTFFNFWNHHCLLQTTNRPKWATIKNGSQTYINALINAISITVYCNQAIRRIHRHPTHVTVESYHGRYDFDCVVIATHADQALRLLDSPTPMEKILLSPWVYTNNQIILHSDCRVAPPAKSAWASWIYTRTCNTVMQASYFMNRLQKLKTPTPFFVTLNSQLPIHSEKIIYTTRYEHPMMTQSSVETQTNLHELNGVKNTYFCGSYFGNGFHEDGIRSAVMVANQLGCPF